MLNNPVYSPNHQTNTHAHSPHESADYAVVLCNLSEEDLGRMLWEESRKVQLFLRVDNVVEVLNGLVVSVHNIRYHCEQPIIVLLLFLHI